jgi:UDP-N-acetylglucosamine acyltransferase
MIHPTAIIDPLAKIDPTVKIGPYTVIEGPVSIGPNCIIQAHVKLIGPLEMGAKNIVHSFAVLGDAPQDLKFRDQKSRLIIGDRNIFREHVTAHRGNDGDTIISSDCFLMVSSHVGHNCRVGNHVTLVNGAVLGGHAQVQDRVIIGGLCAVHQHCRVGRLTMISNASAHSVDIPPFFIVMETNCITQLNAVGLRRSGMSRASINALRLMFKTLYRTHSALPLPKAIEQLPDDLRQVPEVAEFITFIQTSKRGVARFSPWSARHHRQNEPETEMAE